MKYDPLRTICTPALVPDTRGDVREVLPIIQGFARGPVSPPIKGVTFHLLRKRESQLEQFDRKIRRIDPLSRSVELDGFQHKAFDVLTSHHRGAALDTACCDSAAKDRCGDSLWATTTFAAKNPVETGLPVPADSEE